MEPVLWRKRGLGILVPFAPPPADSLPLEPPHLISGSTTPLSVLERGLLWGDSRGPPPRNPVPSPGPWREWPTRKQRKKTGKKSMYLEGESRKKRDEGETKAENRIQEERGGKSAWDTESVCKWNAWEQQILTFHKRVTKNVQNWKQIKKQQSNHITYKYGDKHQKNQGRRWKQLLWEVAQTSRKLHSRELVLSVQNLGVSPGFSSVQASLWEE